MLFLSTGLAGFWLLASNALAAEGIGAVPKLPDSVSNSTAAPTKQARPGFVTTSDGHLYLNGELFDFRTMNAPELSIDYSEFENEDTFATFAAFGAPVTRTYILASVQNDMLGGTVGETVSMVTGWDENADDFTYNEEYLVHWDAMLDLAAQYGVKIIVPLVNQDYGEANDWFGTFTDLIRHRFGIKDYQEANVAHDWFTDAEMLRVFKKIITKALARKNTVNGRVWGEDDTILAWETGNEMNWGVYNATNLTAPVVYKRPPPAEWTISVLEHVRTLAPNTLTMDGSFSRICDDNTGKCPPPAEAWPVAVLESDAVDLISYHYYGDGFIQVFADFANYVTSFGKTFIIGEHGFYSDPDYYQFAWGNMTEAPIAGGMLWGFRPHAETNGFLTHSEYDGVFSYHFPGWDSSPSPMFQKGEGQISRQTYRASWEAVGKSIPPYPVPTAAVLKDASNATAGPGVTWRGATWGESYELWSASIDAPYFQLVGDGLLDNVEEGTLFVPVNPSDANARIETPDAQRHMSEQPDEIQWVDTKWGDADVEAQQKGGSALRTPGRRLKRSEVVSPATEKMMKRMEKQKRGGNAAAGSWYIARALSADDHLPGPFSNPVFVKSNGTGTA